MASQVVEVALQIPDALARLQQIGHSHLHARKGAELLGEIVQALGESAELANVQAVGHGVHVLEDYGQLTLALPGQAVDHLGRPQHVADDLGGRGVGAQVAGAAVAGGIADAHALDAARVVGRNRLALDRHRDVGVAEGHSAAIGALAQLPGYIILAVGDALDHRCHCVCITPGQAVAVEVALLSGFHAHGEHVAHLDAVHAEAVALVDHVGDGLAVAVEAVRTQGPGRLVLIALALDLPLAFLDLVLLLASHRAGMAGRVVDQDVLLHPLAGGVLGVNEGGAHGVLGRQRAHRVDDVHQHVGAVDAQAALARGSHHGLVHDRGQGLLVGVLERDAISRLGLILLVALDDNRLEVFGASHCTRAAAARCALVLVHEVAVAHQLFAGWADGHHRALGATIVLQDLDRVVGFHAPDRRGVVDAHFVVFDVQVDWVVGLALDQQAVEAGPLELGCCPAAHVAVGDSAGQRRLGHHSQPAAHLDLGAGQRAVHNAQQVVRRVRIDIRAVVQHVLDAQAAGADVLAHILGVELLIGDIACGQVDAGDFVVESCNHWGDLLVEL